MKCDYASGMRHELGAKANTRSWRELYRAAVLETDREELPRRIAEAEKALILRARELFVMSGDNNDEGEAIDDALYLLRALRHCLERKTTDLEAA